MAYFHGTIQEYHDYFGPRIRNLINNLTRTNRIRQGGVCQNCGRKAELQSAHIHGKGRRNIIENELAKFMDNGIINCNLKEVEELVIRAHTPIEEVFMFLCSDCHHKYDHDDKSIKNLESRPLPTQLQGNKQLGNSEFRYLHRIRLWAKHPSQINHKIIVAYLKLEKNGKVYLDNLKQVCSDRNSNYYVRDFRGNYAQMKTDLGHPHGKVFYEEDGIVYVYKTVRQEIRDWFEGGIQ